MARRSPPKLVSISSPFPLNLAYVLVNIRFKRAEETLISFSQQTDGVKQVFNVVKNANEHEKELLKKAYVGLKQNIEAGVEFGSKWAPK